MFLSLTDFFNLEGLDIGRLLEFTVRFVFNLLVIIIIVRYIYYKSSRRKDYLFTYLLISVTVFMIATALESVKLELGLALGLFAVFGIIRYRTDPIPIREMTYLFVVIGVSIINALTGSNSTFWELIFVNLMLIFVTWGGEYYWTYKHVSSKRIIYDKIELIKPENQQLFIADLEERTGLNISRVEIGRIDFLKDVAEINIYYFYSKRKMSIKEEKAYEHFQDIKRDDDGR